MWNKRFAADPGFPAFLASFGATNADVRWTRIVPSLVGHRFSGVPLATFVIARFWELPPAVLLVADAFGLALFTLVGTEKSVACGVSPSIAIALGVVTGVGGGMMRDVLSGEIPLVFRKGLYPYATAAFCGAGLFVLFEHFFPGRPLNRLLASGTILLLSLAAIRWKIVLPGFISKSPKRPLRATRQDHGK